MVEAALATARLLTGVSIRAAAVEDITLAQLRALTMVANRDRCNVAAVATGLGVHPSNATRIVDRLVRAGLLDRRIDPADRRHLALGLTERGHELVTAIDHRRRAEIVRILGHVPPDRLDAVGSALQAVAAAGRKDPAGVTDPPDEPA